VLIDRDGSAARMVAAVGPAPPRQPPSAAEFLELVNDFLYHAVWTAKKIRRGELWTALRCCDADMKSQLRRMLEWHAQASGSADTWHRGRFLERWADPRALEDLRSAFARYDDADLRRALLATLDLFRWLAQEVAAILGFAYPSEADARMMEWVTQCLSEV
jgi:aminoglycoside 6-adenylyltransferase